MKSMESRHLRLLLFALLITGVGFAADPYNGPRPPKPDLPYLLHADNLVATEESEATQETKKDDITYAIRGAASPARTPLPEPIFLLESDKLLPEKLELYKLEGKNGRRELTMSAKGKRRTKAKVLRLNVTKIEGRLYRVESAQPLEDGQYSLSPSDSNKVFGFEVY